MPYTDIIILAIFIFFVAKGWLKGFFVEFFTFVGLIVAAFSSVMIYQSFGAVAADLMGISDKLAKGILFLAAFVLIAFLFGFIGRALHKKSEDLELTQMNRTLGAIFGAGKGALVSGVFVLILAKNPVASGLAKVLNNGSFFAGYALDFAQWIIDMAESLF